MSDRTERIKQLAESATEKLLAWQIGLPAPLTFTAEVVKLLLAAYIGWRLG